MLHTSSFLPILFSHKTIHANVSGEGEAARRQAAHPPQKRGTMRNARMPYNASRCAGYSA